MKKQRNPIAKAVKQLRERVIPNKRKRDVPDFGESDSTVCCTGKCVNCFGDVDSSEFYEDLYSDKVK